MTIEQRDKYAYELMVKNNPEEAVKQLLLKDKVIEEKQQRIDKAIEYIEEHKQLSMFADLRKENTHQYDLECDADDLLNILKGEENESN